MSKRRKPEDLGDLHDVEVDKGKLEYVASPAKDRWADLTMPRAPEGMLWLVEVEGWEGDGSGTESRKWDVDVFADLAEAIRLADAIDANSDVRACVEASDGGFPFRAPRGARTEDLDALRAIHEATAGMDRKTRNRYLRENVDVVTWAKTGAPDRSLDATRTWSGCFASMDRVRILPLAPKGEGLWRWRSR